MSYRRSAPRWPRDPRPRPPRRPPDPFKAEEIAEDILKFLEDRGVKAAGFEAAAPQARMSEAVVHRALLRVGKDGVRFAGLAKIRFGLVLILGIAIGMPFQRGLAIGRLDLVGGRLARTARNS